MMIFRKAYFGTTPLCKRVMALNVIHLFKLIGWKQCSAKNLQQQAKLLTYFKWMVMVLLRHLAANPISIYFSKMKLSAKQKLILLILNRLTHDLINYIAKE